MADTVNTAQVKFVADLGSFTAGVSKAASDLTSKLKPAIQDINKSFAALGAAGRKQLESIQANEKIRAGFASLGQVAAEPIAPILAIGTAAEKSAIKAKDVKQALGNIGQAGRSLAPIIGGVTGELILFGSAAASAVKSAAFSIAQLLGPVGLLAVGVTAAASALFFFSFRAAETKAAAQLAKGTIEGLGKEIEKLTTKVKSGENQLQVLKNTLEQIKNLPAGVFDVGGNVNIKEDVIKRQERRIAQQEQALAADKLAKANASIDKINEELSASLRIVNREYELGGERLGYFKGQVDAYTEAKEKALKVEGATDEQIKNYIDSLNTSAASLKAYTEQTELAEEATKKLNESFNATEPSEKDFKDIQASRKGAFIPLDTIVGPVDTRSFEAEKAKLEDLEQGYASLTETVRLTTGETLNAIAGLVDTTIQGISATIAEAAITGKSFAELMTSVYAAAAQQLIQLAVKSFLEIVGQTIALIWLKNIEAYSAIPFVGLALGVAGAAAAIAAARSGSSKHGGKAFAEGGIVTGPVVGLLGEAGTEVVLPLSQLSRFVNPGGKVIHTHVYLDGKEVALAVGKELPGILRARGVKG